MGLAIRKDHRLAEKKKIVFEDLIGIDLICSEQGMKFDIARWCGEKTDRLNLSGTINLCYNGGVFVEKGLGCMLTFERLMNTGDESGLCFSRLLGGCMLIDSSVPTGVAFKEDADCAILDFFSNFRLMYLH